MTKAKWHLAVLGLLFVSRILASPCITDTLANYEALGATGCTINGEIADSFNFTVNSTNLVSPLTAGAITVTPSFVGNSKFQLLFSATGNTPATGFTLSGTSFAKYEIDFNWDPLVGGAGDDMVANTPVFPGTATVTTSLCAGCPLPFNIPTNTVTVFNDGKPSDAIDNAVTFFGSQVLIVGSKSVIDLEANGASSTISGFDTYVFATPEPGTLALFLVGQAIVFRGLSIRRRRLRPAKN